MWSYTRFQSKKESENDSLTIISSSLFQIVFDSKIRVELRFLAEVGTSCSFRSHLASFSEIHTQVIEAQPLSGSLDLGIISSLSKNLI